jgi:hypothetical protein
MTHPFADFFIKEAAMGNPTATFRSWMTMVPVIGVAFGGAENSQRRRSSEQAKAERGSASSFGVSAWGYSRQKANSQSRNHCDTYKSFHVSSFA